MTISKRREHSPRTMGMLILPHFSRLNNGSSMAVPCFPCISCGSTRGCLGSQIVAKVYPSYLVIWCNLIFCWATRSPTVYICLLATALCQLHPENVGRHSQQEICQILVIGPMSFSNVWPLNKVPGTPQNLMVHDAAHYLMTVKFSKCSMFGETCVQYLFYHDQKIMS